MIARFFINELATRTNLRTVMDYLRDVYVLWASFTNKTSSPPVPGMLDLAERILERFPHWKTRFDAWFKRQGDGMSAAYACATSLSNWDLVSRHLRNGANFMIETHDRNVDDDFSNVRGSEKMPVKS